MKCSHGAMRPVFVRDAYRCDGCGAEVAGIDLVRAPWNPIGFWRRCIR